MGKADKFPDTFDDLSIGLSLDFGSFEEKVRLLFYSSGNKTKMQHKKKLLDPSLTFRGRPYMKGGGDPIDYQDTSNLELHYPVLYFDGVDSREVGQI